MNSTPKYKEIKYSVFFDNTFNPSENLSFSEKNSGLETALGFTRQ
jgi:hypothetical protein